MCNTCPHPPPPTPLPRFFPLHLQRELRSGFDTHVQQPSPQSILDEPHPSSSQALPLPASVLRDLAVVFAADALPMSAAAPQLTAPALLADLDTLDLGAAIQVGVVLWALFSDSRCASLAPPHHTYHFVRPGSLPAHYRLPSHLPVPVVPQGLTLLRHTL